MPDSVLLILAETLATELLKAGYRSLGRIARGSPQYAALQQAWTEALQATLAGLLPDFDQNERDHLEGVFRVYIQAPSVADNLLALALVDGQPDMALLASQFSSCGLDHDSLLAYYQLGFSTWLGALLENLQASLRRFAASDGSPLYNLVSLGKLDAIAVRLQEVDRQLAEISLAVKRLREGSPSTQDLALLRQALQTGQLNVPGPGVSVGGSVQGNIVIGDNVNIVTLNAEALRLLLPKQYSPLPLPPPSDPPPLPGPLPPGSRLPFPRNALFTGRKDELLSLSRTLFYDHNPAAISQPAGLTGMGGLGKTQLAVELAYRYGRCLHGVHWIAADQNIAAEIAACGAAMNLSPWSDKLPEQLSLTLQAWGPKASAPWCA